MHADELVCGCVGVRMHWCADALVCGCIGVQMSWHADALVSRRSDCKEKRKGNLLSINPRADGVGCCIGV